MTCKARFIREPAWRIDAEKRVSARNALIFILMNKSINKDRNRECPPYGDAVVYLAYRFVSDGQRYKPCIGASTCFRSHCVGPCYLSFESGFSLRHPYSVALRLPHRTLAGAGIITVWERIHQEIYATTQQGPKPILRFAAVATPSTLHSRPSSEPTSTKPCRSHTMIRTHMWSWAGWITAFRVSTPILPMSHSAYRARSAIRTNTKRCANQPSMTTISHFRDHIVLSTLPSTLFRMVVM